MLERVAKKVSDGGRLGAAEALTLYRHAPTYLLGGLADAIRARKHPARIVSYIIDRNVNYTNVCVARCNFCAFYRAVGSPEGYVLGFEDILRKIAETMAVGGDQLLLQGATIQICRSSGTRICSAPSRCGIRTSSCTRCRLRRSCISHGLIRSPSPQ